MIIIKRIIVFLLILKKWGISSPLPNCYIKSTLAKSHRDRENFSDKKRVPKMDTLHRTHSGNAESVLQSTFQFLHWKVEKSLGEILVQKSPQDQIPSKDRK